MKFLIVAPKYTPTVGVFYEFPLGLAYISSHLKNQGYEVECLNPNHSYEPLEKILTRTIKERRIDVVCTGGLSPHYSQINRILKIAKGVHPDILTIIGGGLVSCEPEMVMEMLPADIGVIGEGDHTICDIADALCNRRPLHTVKGIIHKDGEGNINITAPRSVIKNIDEILPPDYEGFEIDAYLSMQFRNDQDHLNFYENPRVLPLVASRGCPYRCTFCFHPLGKKYRQHSLDYLFRQIDILVERYGVNGLLILDELFSTNNNYTRLVEFCRRIKEYGIYWFAQMRVDSVNKEILDICKDSGCVVISYGIESASNTVLKSLKKKITVEQIDETLARTYQAGIGTKGNLIFGDKEETLETANESLRWWHNNKKYQIKLSVLNPYPGTELYHYGVNKGIIRDKRQFLTQGRPVNLTRMSDEEFVRMLQGITYLRNDRYLIPAHVLSSKKVDWDEIKGPIYHVEIGCPHCGKHNYYNNMNHKYGNIQNFPYLMYCGICGQKFSVLPFNVEEQIHEFIAAIGDEKAAIMDVDFPVLYELGLRLMEHMESVISSKPGAERGHFQGKPIRGFHGSNGRIEDHVKFLVYPICEFKKGDLQEIRQLEKDGFNVLRLYAFQNCKKAMEMINGLRSIGEDEEAKTALKHAEDQFPISAGLANIKGEMEVERGDLNGAVQRFTDIIKKWPYDWEAYNNLGTVLHMEGDIAKALELFETAGKLDPQNSLVLSNKEECLMSLLSGGEPERLAECNA